MTTPECPKCRRPMNEGFLLDHTHGGIGQSQWTEGQPRRSFWTGVVVKKKARVDVTTYRCPRCGYLESYAAPS